MYTKDVWQNLPTECRMAIGALIKEAAWQNQIADGAKGMANSFSFNKAKMGEGFSAFKTGLTGGMGNMNKGMVGGLAAAGGLGLGLMAARKRKKENEGS